MEISSWETADVGDWLCSIGHPEFAGEFIAHGICGTALLGITEEHLKVDLGIVSIGPRIKLWQAIQALKLHHEEHHASTTLFGLPREPAAGAAAAAAAASVAATAVTTVAPAAAHPGGEIKIGDVISLTLASADADQDGTLPEVFFLNGGGILDSAVAIAASWSMENLFQVCTRSHVTSAEECMEWKAQHVGSLSDEDKVVEDALMRVMGKEQERNTLNMEDQRGTTVAFGDIIQLRHVRSNSFLTVPSHRAAWMPGLKLSKTASSLSWFQFSPSNKIYAVGDPVSSGCESFIEIAGDHSGEFVSAGLKPKALTQLRSLYVH